MSAFHESSTETSGAAERQMVTLCAPPTIRLVATDCKVPPACAILEPMTTALYHQDPLLSEFTATVTAVENLPDGSVEVELDRTAFYPEGGGQPADRGTIDHVPVRHVRNDGTRILHRLEAAPSGAQIRGVVDGPHRREYMQQHTGQHVLSSSLLRIAGLRTVAVHQGEEFTTIEVDGEQVSDGQIRLVEEEANRVIELDLPVTAKEVAEEEVYNYPLRRPPQKSGALRLVFVGEIDCAACGGVHLPRTGMIRLIQHAGNERIRGRTRTYWKIGDRAIEDYRAKSDICTWIVDTYSVPLGEITRRLQHEQERVDLLTKEVEHERHLRALTVAAGISAGAQPLSGRDVPEVRAATARLDGESAGFLRLVAETLVETRGLAFCLIAQDSERVHWSMGAGPDTSIDFTRLRQELLPRIEAKGGGRPPLWQGVGSPRADATAFLSAFGEYVHGPQTA